MKKTLLFTIALASIASISKTSGEVEFKNDNKYDVTEKEFEVSKGSLNTKVKVEGTGLSFGGVLEASELKLPLQESPLENLLYNSSAYIKYELPEISKVNSYLKAETDSESIKLVADVNYPIFPEVKVGLNTYTKVAYINGETYSSHKAYLESKKVKDLKDVSASLSVQHGYNKANLLKDRLKFVKADAKATYIGVDKLEVTGKFNFAKQYDDNFLEDQEYFDLAKGDKELLNKGMYHHSYELDAKYKVNDEVEASTGAYVQHVNYDNSLYDYQTSTIDGMVWTGNSVYYGFKIGTKYKGLENTTLKADAVFSGVYQKQDITYLPKQNDNTHSTSTSQESKYLNLTHHGDVKLNLGAKYDYKVTDKFTLMPELNAKLNFPYIYVGKTAKMDVNLTIEPKVAIEYKPTDKLVIKGNVSSPIKFVQDITQDFGFKNATVKSSLNIKYMW